jgi:hypothetical protein
MQHLRVRTAARTERSLLQVDQVLFDVGQARCAYDNGVAMLALEQAVMRHPS